MKRQLSKRLLAMLLAAVMLAGFALPASAAEPKAAGGTPSVTWEQVDNSEVSAKIPLQHAKVEEQKPDYADTDMVRVSIVLEKKATISAGFAPETYAANAKAQTYRHSLLKEQDKVAAAISKKALEGQELDVVWNLTLAANLISANVPYGKLDAIRNVKGVKSVVIEKSYAPAVVSTDSLDPNMATSGAMIGSSAAWNSGYTGAGSRIAVIDTGIDTDHQSFAAEGFAYSLACNAAAKDMSEEAYVASLELLNADEIAKAIPELNIAGKLEEKGWSADELYRTSKIAFGYNYVDNSLDITHDNDRQTEHGSHVEGIAAANAYIPNADGSFSKALEAVNVQGVAPDAQILTMKVFGRNGGAFDSDYMAAIEDAIVLKADSINLSLGSANPGYSAYWSEEEQIYQGIMDDLVKSGVVVTMSAGNSSQWSSEATEAGLPYADDIAFNMVGSPGSYTNPLTVASADNIGGTGDCFRVGDENIIYTETQYKNALMTTLAGEQQYILIDGYGEDSEFAALSDVLVGKIAVCSRGSNSFYVKANNAVKYGAIATVIYNNAAGTISMNLDGYNGSAPCVSITQAQGKLMKDAAVKKTTAGGAVYYEGTMTVSNQPASSITYVGYDTVSSFSSCGIPGTLEMKPEITAPGGNIYSVNGAIAGGKAYENMSGTSMAAPQVAGMAALVAQYIRENGLAEKTGLSARRLAQSLLMSTAVPMKDADGSYWSILKQGSGLANVNNAIQSGSYILMGDNATASAADGKVKVELGDDPGRDGEYTFDFTLNNLTDAAQGYSLSADLFTQALKGEYLDLATAALTADVIWNVDGKTLEQDASLNDCDFDGNGKVDAQDGQILLEYASQMRDSISAAAYADLNDDGSITTYDAYLFLSKLNSGAVSLPADGSVKVTVTLKLTQAQKDTLDKAYPNGAYLEGFVYASPMNTADGAIGVTHSIPVLGFYGNWSDPSMYDIADMVSYIYDTEKREPYLSENSNHLNIQYAGDANVYCFGGNPVLLEDEYLEERNAFNNTNGDIIPGYSFDLIRNALAAKLTVTDVDTGKVYFENIQNRELYSAFYHTNQSQWVIPGWRIGMNSWQGTDKDGNKLPEGTTVEVKLQVAPEYYVDKDGTVAWDALGRGTVKRTQLTIDNTAPTLESVQIDPIQRKLTIVAKDNEYLSCVALMNRYGTEMIALGNPNQNVKGQAVTLEVGAEDLTTGELLLQVYDYAMNTVTYRLHVGEALGVEEPKYDFYGFNYEGQHMMWMGFNKGTETADDFHGFAPTDNYNGFIAATEVDGYVYGLREVNKELCVMPLDALENETVIGVVSTSYFTINDLCYNEQDGYLYGVVYIDNTLVRIDKLTAEYEVVGKINFSENRSQDLRNIACDDKGNFYALCYNTSYNGGILYRFTLDDVTENGIQATRVGETGYWMDQFQSLAWDRKDGCLYWTRTSAINEKPEVNELMCIEPNKVSNGKVSTYRVGKLMNQVTGLIIPGSYVSGKVDAGWDKPTNTVRVMTISQDTLKVVRGQSEQLSVDLRPWTLSTFDLNWTSSDASIATVDADGTVHGVSNGTATITAASVADPTASVSCEVEVYSFQASLKGLMDNGDGTSSLITWDLDKESAPNITDVTVNHVYSTVTCNPTTNTLYGQSAQDDTLQAIDASTGEITKTLAIEAPHFYGMSYCKYFDSNKIMAVDDTTYYKPFTEDGKIEYLVDASHQLEQMFARRFTAATAFGEDKKQYGPSPTYGEALYALDDTGMLWNVLTYYSSYSKTYGYMGTPSYIGTKLGTKYNFNPLAAGAVTSMVSDPANNAIFVNYFDGTTNNIFCIQLTKNQYGSINGTTTALVCSGGDKAVSLYDVDFYGTQTVAVQPDCTEVATVADMQEAAKPTPVTGSLNAVGMDSVGTVDSEKNTGTVIITAKNAAGEDAASTNGLITVKFNPDEVKLDSYTVGTTYKAAEEAAGSLRFGYVELEGAEQLAELHFTRLTDEAATVTVEHKQIGSDVISYTETITLATPALQVVDSLTGKTIANLTAEELESVSITELAQKLGCLTSTVDGKTYAFAGWYTEAQPEGFDWTAKVATDEELVVDNTIYAYFIDAGYLNTTIAYTSNATRATKVYALSTVPGDVFASYGILLSTAPSAGDGSLVRDGAPIDGLKIKDVNKTTVYSYISVAPFTAKTTANVLNGGLGGANNGDGYLTYAAITNMPLGKTLSARSYYVTQDGTVVYGTTSKTVLEASSSITGLQ